jgi:probable rRNA maturation factor
MNWAKHNADLDMDSMNGLVVALEAEPAEGDGVVASELRRMLGEVLSGLSLGRVDVNVVIVDDATMASLHERFSGIAGTTDVLTFDLSDEPRTEPPADAMDRATVHDVEGEVYVCLDEARRRAAELGHPVAHELLLYGLHGVLHLLGFDDHEEADYQRMHALEDRLLRAGGIGAVFDRDGGLIP